MKTVLIHGTEYLLVPGNGCTGCALGPKNPFACSDKYPQIATQDNHLFCGPVHNNGVNHILRPNTPEERAELFALKASKA